MSDSEVTINMQLRPADGDEYTLRQIALGTFPGALIEIVDADDAGNMTINIDSTGPTSPMELAEFLEFITYNLKRSDELTELEGDGDGT